MTRTKSILKSKTFWFNLVALAVWAAEALGEFPDLLPAEFYKWFALVVVVGNKLLRLQTRTAVRLGKAKRRG